MAGVAGIEPAFTVLETAVLPLNYTPVPVGPVPVGLVPLCLRLAALGLTVREPVNPSHRTVTALRMAHSLIPPPPARMIFAGTRGSIPKNPALASAFIV